IGREIAPDLRLHAKRGKESGGHCETHYLFGRVAAGIVEQIACERLYPGEGPALLPQIEKIGDAERRAISPGRFRLSVTYHHQAFGILERQWTEQDGIDHSENRRIRSDAQAECQRGDECESGIFPHHPQAIPNILKERLDKSYSTHFAVRLPQ